MSTYMGFNLLLCQTAHESICLCVNVYIYFNLLDSAGVSTYMGSGCHPINVQLNR